MAHTAPTANTIDGVLQIKGRVGFILSEQENVPDILVQGPSLKMARDGDRVRARLNPARGADRRSGTIVSVVTRARKTAVGAIQRLEGALYLVPPDEDFRVRLTDVGGLQPHEGHTAVAEV